MDDVATEMGPELRRSAPAWQAWLESAALAAALLAAGALLDGRDPFLLRRGFSWLALAPLLAGLRYGSVPGMACGAVQALVLAVAWRWGGVAPASVPEVALGWLVAGLVAGGFRDAWSRRARLLEARGDRLRRQLDGLTRAHRILEASHDRLQRGAPGRPESLRDALAAFRRELAEPIGAESLGAAGGRILALLSRHAFVRAATLHAVDRSGRPGPAIASLGAGGEAGDDRLVRSAAQLGEVVSVRDTSERCLVLAAVPLVDVEGRVHAVVAIHDLPFVALHAETLDLLAALGGYVGDLVSQAAPPARRDFRSVGRARDLGGFGRRQEAGQGLERASWRSDPA